MKFAGWEFLFHRYTQGLVCDLDYVDSFCLNPDGQDLRIFRMCGVYAFASEVVEFYFCVFGQV